MDRTIPYISKEFIEITIKSNIYYVKSIEEFESIELERNTAFLAFDDGDKQCFYFRDRNRFGEYSRTKIFYYEDFAQRVSSIEREEFIKKCKHAKLSETDTLIAEKCFIENLDNEHLWDWLLKSKIKDIELDSVRTIRWRLRKKLYPELIKHPKKKSR